MTDHEKAHLEKFGLAFQQFSNAVDEIMKHPSAEKGYILHQLHQTVVFEYTDFIQCSVAEEIEDRERKNDPEEPAPDAPKKELVN